MRRIPRSAFLSLVTLLLPLYANAAFGQFGLPGLGSKSKSDNQHQTKLLQDNLPLSLNANDAYPTVPNEDLLGGPFQGQVLPITLDTLIKPLPPGDYVIPMTFFCSEYSVHRPGRGVAYTLGPAEGSASKAISTLLWRGMLTGHTPQELQAVSWSIQGGVTYDKMPAPYKKLVDQLIPDMQAQVNGQGWTNIEDGMQGAINRGTKKVSDTLTKGLGAVTGGRGKVTIQVRVQMDQQFEQLGRLGRMAIDGEHISDIVTAAYPDDEARNQALFAGQGGQSTPLPAANGPWSVKIPGVAYMRFTVKGGNLQGDNYMQIRILPSRAVARSEISNGPHLQFASFESAVNIPSLSVLNLFGGSFNSDQAATCSASSGNASYAQCIANSITVAGMTGYAVGTGAQAPIMAPPTPLAPPTQPAQANNALPQQLCVRKLLYQPTYLPGWSDTRQGDFGVCIYLAAVDAKDNACAGQTIVTVPSGYSGLAWVQTFETDQQTFDPPIQAVQESCKIRTPHKDPCNRKTKPMIHPESPLYRADEEDAQYHSPHQDFIPWSKAASSQGLGNAVILFRDVPNRNIPVKGTFEWSFNTSLDPDNQGPLDNHLRLVAIPTFSSTTGYRALLEVSYGLRLDTAAGTIHLDPLTIGEIQVPHSGGTEELKNLKSLATHDLLPVACTFTGISDPGNSLPAPPKTFKDFIFDQPGP